MRVQLSTDWTLIKLRTPSANKRKQRKRVIAVSPRPDFSGKVDACAIQKRAVLLASQQQILNAAIAAQRRGNKNG